MAPAPSVSPCLPCPPDHPGPRAAPVPSRFPAPTGKSSLVIQYIENHFVESYYPTIESVFNKTVNYKGVEYDCDIIDTAGQVRFSPRVPSPSTSAQLR